MRGLASPELKSQGRNVIDISNSFQEQEWPLVSVLFVTYKRFDLLAQSVDAFVKHTDYPNYEIVISDDGSPLKIQDAIRALPVEKRTVLPTRNRGLGANFNQGMAECRGKYILTLQDDWKCHGPSDYLRTSVMLLEHHPLVGMILYTMGLAYRPESAAISGLKEIAYFYPDDASKRDYPYTYSDQPHLRRREVNTVVGPYLEDRDMVKCEQDYERRWDQQTVYKSAMFPAYWLKVFTCIGGEDRSFRETRLKNRTDRLLAPIANRLRSHKRLFRLGRTVVRKIQRLLGGFD